MGSKSGKQQAQTGTSSYWPYSGLFDGFAGAYGGCLSPFKKLFLFDRILISIINKKLKLNNFFSLKNSKTIFNRAGIFAKMIFSLK